MGMTENQIKAVSEQFAALTRKNQELQNAVTWLSMGNITVTRLVRHLLLESHEHKHPWRDRDIVRTTEEEAKELEQQTLIQAGKDLAKMHAGMRHSMDTDDMFNGRFGLNLEWGQKKAK